MRVGFPSHPFEKVQLETRRAAQEMVPRSTAQLCPGESFALIYLEVFIDFTFLCKNTDLIYEVIEEGGRIILPIRAQNCPANCPGKREKICWSPPADVSHLEYRPIPDIYFFDYCLFWCYITRSLPGRKWCSEIQQDVFFYYLFSNNLGFNPFLPLFFDCEPSLPSFTGTAEHAGAGLSPVVVGLKLLTFYRGIKAHFHIGTNKNLLAFFAT